ncbi:MAG: 50S ribosomal protein L18 [Bacteroidetes bacterium]|nr:50S ribosomal protein L18 [Bacteroidota bacterium]MCY4204951.1 50S ribosomal protein L18 [Bacteroidota bacterium]
MSTCKFKSTKSVRRFRAKRSIRRKVHGTAERPRLTVFRSNRNIYAQLINDDDRRTLAAASTLDEGHQADSPVSAGAIVGERLAARATEHGIKKAVFDRNGYRYHGRVRSLAEGARKGGLEF